MSSKLLSSFAVGVAALAVAAAAGAAHGRQAAGIYTVHGLVSDSSAVPAAATDASLVNGWGLSAGPTTPWWAANNGTNTSTLYSGTGAKTPLTVSVAGAPTGTVFNGNAADFAVSQNGKTGAARFLFSTEGGTILGWTPSVNGTAAVVAADRSSAGAVYKGLATARRPPLRDGLPQRARRRLRCVVRNPVTTAGGFKDAKVAKGFDAVRDRGARRQHLRDLCEAGRRREGRTSPAPGQAYVDEFSPDGQLLAHVVNSGKKNAPLNAPVGPRARSGDVRLLRGRPRRRQLRQRPDERLHPGDGSTWVYKGELRLADGTLDRDRRSPSDLRSENGAAAGPTNPLLPVRPSRREARALRVDHGGQEPLRLPGLAAGVPADEAQVGDLRRDLLELRAVDVAVGRELRDPVALPRHRDARRGAPRRACPPRGRGRARPPRRRRSPPTRRPRPRRARRRSAGGRRPRQPASNFAL